jgi:hypothetical protein
MGLWENINSARLRLDFIDFVAVRALRSVDNRSVITINGLLPPTTGGTTALYLSAREHRISEFDIEIRSSAMRPNPAPERFFLPHELGHGLGYEHSLLNRRVLNNLDEDPLRRAARSRESVMSYDPYATIAAPGPGREVLLEDDIATISRLNPEVRYGRKLARTTASCRGTLLDASGNPAYGVAVFLVNRASGAAVIHRMSGWENYDHTWSGYFELNGAPSGVYDLLAVGTDYRNAGRGLYKSGAFGLPEPVMAYSQVPAPPGTPAGELVAGWDEGNVDNYLHFANHFRPTWVRNIYLRQGDVIEIGNLREGENRDHTRVARGLWRNVMTWPEATRAAGGGATADALSYLVEVEGVATQAFMHGRRYVADLPGGLRRYRVNAGWSLSEQPSRHQDWRNATGP